VRVRGNRAYISGYTAWSRPARPLDPPEVLGGGGRARERNAGLTGVGCPRQAPVRPGVGAFAEGFL